MPNTVSDDEPVYLVGLCFRACYDNPLFADDDDKEREAHAKGGGPRPTGGQDGHVTAPRDYVHTLPPTEMRFTTKSRRSILLRFIFSVLFLALVVALIIGLFVHFLQNQDSSIRTSPSSVITISSRVQGSLMIEDGPFSVYREGYGDNSSAHFNILQESFQFKMDHIFKTSRFMDVYSRTDILRISRGSVVLHFVIRLKEPRSLTSQDVREMVRLIQDGLQDSIIAVNRESVYLKPDVLLPPASVKPSDQCEMVRIFECINVTDYQLTVFPNILGHPTQEIASHALLQVTKVFSTACHGYTFKFLCGLLAPECGPHHRPIPPCRSFCEAPACIPVRNQHCLQEGFNNTSFPNMIGNEGEDEVTNMILLMKALEAATSCYKYLMVFACSAFLPPCSGNQTLGHHLVPPCRSLCQATRDRCEIFLDIFYMPWPEALSCDRLPDSPEPGVCVGYSQAREPPDLGDCQVGEMHCDRGTRCVKASWVCDGYRDCEDNTDEKDCEPRDQVFPVSMLCINTTNVCDGDDHCYEGVDESECVRVGADGDDRLLEVRNPLTGEWEGICSNGWNFSMSLLTCRQLGYRLAACPSDDGREHVVKVSCWKPVCGTRPAHHESLLRVVGGEEVTPGTWPWMASLHGGSDEKFFCGASVIAPQWVLTAGHCVGGGVRETHYWTIKTGHTRRTSYSPYRIAQATALFLHPDFNPQTVDNDIALIQLRTPLVLSDYLRPVCLPDVGNFVAIGTRCMVAGWGRVKDSVC
ncbi:hypothetical protein C0Q70_01292 [Pomacea canaliculata]|uniref:Atrial natriuretic peptide-converting enzyme n=1 Tax=Pomacea canaliculata TaxID=400727 RepID=A0A2T7PZ16_POMCA|nr:hypothetical protein C0Q70_01292 [Pomacea canaliculata]